MSRGSKHAAILAAICVGGLAPTESAFAAGDEPLRFVPGELVVRFAAGTARSEQAAVRRELGADLRERLLVPRAQVVELAADDGVTEAAAAFERRPEVRYAEPNFTYRLDSIPNDPLFWEQAALHDTGQPFGDLDGTPPTLTGTYDADIDAPEAWSITTGDPGVTIAIADSGVDYTHPDLAPNIVPGYDFGADDGDPYPDGINHGTHVAGTAGAAGDNRAGIAGVSWRSTLMPLKVAKPNGVIAAADLADAFAYAGSQGVQIVNASLGGEDASGVVRDAIDAAPNTLFVVSAGNDSADVDHLLYTQFPCEHTAPNIICVTATNLEDVFSSGYANFGAVSVDLAAPGSSVLSTIMYTEFEYTGPFGFKSGTSMATAQVAGTAALILAHNPGASVAEVKGAILGGVDPLPSLAGKTATGGRLNAKAALAGTGELEVETVITKGPKKKNAHTNASSSTASKRKVRFAFDSPTHRPVDFLCKLDKRDFAPCFGSIAYRASRGRHTFSVKAIDLIGREDPTPATYRFRVKPRNRAAGRGGSGWPPPDVL
jgi:subtilisin family serine protease